METHPYERMPLPHRGHTIILTDSFRRGGQQLEHQAVKAAICRSAVYVIELTFGVCYWGTSCNAPLPIWLIAESLLAAGVYATLAVIIRSEARRMEDSLAVATAVHEARDSGQTMSGVIDKLSLGRQDPALVVVRVVIVINVLWWLIGGFWVMQAITSQGGSCDSTLASITAGFLLCDIGLGYMKFSNNWSGRIV